MVDQQAEIKRLSKELAIAQKNMTSTILESRLRERDKEYQHRLLELELASEGIIPVGLTPEAKVHGGKEFTELMEEIEVDKMFSSDLFKTGQIS